MYWKDRTNKVHKISEMSTEYLINCKKMLERSDLQISTLRKPSNSFIRESIVQVDKCDYESYVTYDSTTSQEYQDILLELRHRGL
jgi:hypothetical protein